MSATSSQRVSRVIGALGVIGGVGLTPPVVSWLFSIDALHRDDLLPMWGCAVALVGCSLVVLSVRRRRVGGPLAAMLLFVLVLLGVEAGARVWVMTWSEKDQVLVLDLARRTYPGLLAYEPHPFFQFTGRSGGTLKGNEALRGTIEYNDRGFFGPNWEIEKPEGVVRVACLGASTTASGYPRVMAEHVTAMMDGKARAESLNFGIGHYTTAHSVAIYALMVPDYSPDYVVIHQGWNDKHARNRTGHVYSDYSHALKAFEFPHVPDVMLIRGSFIYRYVKHRVLGDPPWVDLSQALGKHDNWKRGPKFLDPSELIPYYRNLHTILDLALARGEVPILVTQPRSHDSEIRHAGHALHIDQCNEVQRAVAKEYEGRVLFVDLDSMVSGEHDEFFVDVGHMTREGIEFKAKAIGDALYADWVARRLRAPK